MQGLKVNMMFVCSPGLTVPGLRGSFADVAQQFHPALADHQTHMAVRLGYAPAWVVICISFATRAIDPNRKPPTISATIMA